MEVDLSKSKDKKDINKSVVFGLRLVCVCILIAAGLIVYPAIDMQSNDWQNTRSLDTRFEETLSIEESNVLLGRIDMG